MGDSASSTANRFRPKGKVGDWPCHWWTKKSFMSLIRVVRKSEEWTASLIQAVWRSGILCSELFPGRQKCKGVS